MSEQESGTENRKRKRRRGAAESSTAVFPREADIPLPDGTEIRVGELRPSDYYHLSEDALDHYKRQMIKTWRDNADLLPEEERSGAIRDAFHKASEMTFEDLPDVKWQTIVVDGNGDFKTDDDGKFARETTWVPYAAWWMESDVNGLRRSVWRAMRRVNSAIEFSEVSERLDCCTKGQLQDIAGQIGELSRSRLAKN